MTAPPNGNRAEARAVPLLVLIPHGALGARFQVIGQWHTGVGILCPPQQVAAQALPPQMVVELFVRLVNQGLVHQVYTDDQGVVQRAPLPVVVLEFGKLPEEPETPKIITTEG